MNSTIRAVCALAVLLVPVPAPVSADVPSHAVSLPSGPRAFTDLSLADRANLPDSTQVVYGNHHLATLGHLRAVHAALVTSRASASRLGHPSVLLSKVIDPASPVLPLGAVFKPISPIVSPTVVPIGSPVLTPIVVVPPIVIPVSTPAPNPNAALPAAPNGEPLPNDYALACAGATLCLYYPANVAAFGNSSLGNPASGVQFWSDVEDPLITTASECQSTGGQFVDTYCIYYYPTVTQLTFVPGPTGFQLSGSCPIPPTTGLTDPHGVVKIDDGLTYTQSAIAQPVLCYLQIKPGPAATPPPSGSVTLP